MVEYHDILSASETNALLDRAQAGDSDAVDLIIIHNQRMVEAIANRYYVSGYGGDQELADLVQWGNIGLLRAIQKWDPGRGYRFTTYATHWINGVIRRNGAIRGSSLGMTHRETIKLSAIRRARATLTQSLGRTPDAEDIAKYTGLKLEYIITWFPALSFPISLDSPIGKDNGDEDAELHELISVDDEGTDEIAMRKALLAELCQKINQLPPRQCEVITRRYLINPPHTCKQIAYDMHITFQRVEQIERDALCALRRMVLK
jgi:RNA polymerase primary sigma factor